MADSRPELNEKISVEDFEGYYWLKAELVEFCRKAGLTTTGGKIEIANRIKIYLVTGELPGNRSKITAKSKFNWSTATLTSKTIITDNYKNTENVRAFFKNQIGPQFKFNVPFMDWMRNNSGKTLHDAVLQWKEITTNAKASSGRKEIAPQFEYNTYIRDFLENNPGVSKSKAIQCWNIKKKLKGRNVYQDSDLKLISGKRI